MAQASSSASADGKMGFGNNGDTVTGLDTKELLVIGGYILAGMIVLGVGIWAALKLFKK